MKKCKTAKRILTVLLCGLLTTSMLSCNLDDMAKMNTSATVTTTPPQDEGGSQNGGGDLFSAASCFSSYESIIETYEIISKNRNVDLAQFNVDNVSERLWLGVLRDAISRLAYDSSAYYQSIRSQCYAFYDFNGDGVDELVLLRADGYIYALFAMQNGRPTLIEYEQCQGGLYINASGKIVKRYSKPQNPLDDPYPSAYYITGFYTVDLNGRLVLECELGTRTNNFEYGKHYYCIQDGVRYDVSSQSYTEMMNALTDSEYQYTPWKQTRQTLGDRVTCLLEYEDGELIESGERYHVYWNAEKGVYHYDILDENGIIWYNGELNEKWDFRVNDGKWIKASYALPSGLEKHIYFTTDYCVWNSDAVVGSTEWYVAFLSRDLSAGEVDYYNQLGIMETYGDKNKQMWWYSLDFSHVENPIVSVKFLSGQQLEVVYLSGEDCEKKTTVLDFSYPAEPEDNEWENGKG